MIEPLRLAAIVIAWALFGLIHSALAATPVRQRLIRRWPGLRPVYRLLYNILAALLLIPPLALTWLYSGKALWHWPAWFEWGVFLLVAAGFLFTMRWYDGLDFIGLRQWRQRRSPTECGEAFILSPLHRHVRHPWYSMGLLYLWTRDLNAAWLAAAGTITLYIVIGSRLEERKLVESFGEPYRRYLERVPGLVPLPWRHLSREEAGTMTCETPQAPHKKTD